MYPQWQTRNAGNFRSGNDSKSLEKMGSSREVLNNGRFSASIDEDSEVKRPWLKDLDKKKNWNREATGWTPREPRDTTSFGGCNGGVTYGSDSQDEKYENRGVSNGYPKTFTSLNKANSNLWNRRKTSSTNSIPTLTKKAEQPSRPNLHLDNLHHTPSSSLRRDSRDHNLHPLQYPSFTASAPQSFSPSNSSASPGDKGGTGFPRGASMSPKVAHSKGFWVQEPEDLQQRWHKTETPQSGGSSPQTAVCSSPVLISGSGDPSETPSNEVPLDFQNRVKRFQPLDSQLNSSSTPPNTNGRSTSSVVPSPIKRGQIPSTAGHSLSQSNLSELKSSSSKKAQSSSSTTKSSSNLSELKTSSNKSSNLSELKSSITEVKNNITEMTASNSMNFSRSMSSKSAMQQSSASSSSSTMNAATSATTASAGFGKLMPSYRSMGSLDALSGLNTGDVMNELDPGDLDVDGGQLVSSSPGSSQREMKFQEQKSTASSKIKVVKDNQSYETESGTQSESRKLQSGDVSYEESSRAAASKSKLERDGVTAEKGAQIKQEARQLRAGDVTHREESLAKGAAMKISGDGFSAHQAAMSQQHKNQTTTPSGTISQERLRKASKSGLTINNAAGGVCTQQSVSTSSENNISISGFEDFDLMNEFSQPMDIQNAMMKFSGTMSNFVSQLKDLQPSEGLDAPKLLENMNEMIKKAWSVPSHGHHLGSSICNVLRHNGGLDILLDNCDSVNEDLKYSSARVLEQCLTTENREYVVEKGLEKVVGVACDCASISSSKENSRVGTGILEHLFKHSEDTCSDIIKMGGLDAVIKKCRNSNSDRTTLQHCAGALANLSLYGGSENHQVMMKRHVEHWLFPLAFHEDDNIKYYACLAIAALVANKEIEAAVTKSGTLKFVEPFVSEHLPEEFANSTDFHKHGQSRSWLQRLVPVLTSKREEARNLAAFHFCMEAAIKNKQGNLDIFREIGAIQPLKEVASSPHAIASSYAAKALHLMGEEVPHKLSQQVPVWSREDVKEWVKQIDFIQYAEMFLESKVDGDLLLQISDENLKEDLGMSNGMLRQRFMRELRELKLKADYSSCDSTKLNDFLISLEPNFAEYTYKMIKAGVTKDYLRYISKEQLQDECTILNSIHREKIFSNIMTDSDTSNMEKDLDIFISYRRSNGSQLASLLRVHTSLMGFTVFIDVDRLEAGKFDNNLLNSVRSAKHFLLVLTAGALDRCIGDDEGKDWVHKEIVSALNSDCRIIPIIDNFDWPPAESLPEDMRAVCAFNGIKWVHDYQEACVEKVERFLRGDGQGKYSTGNSRLALTSCGGGFTPGTPSSLRGPPIYQRTASVESGKGSSCSDKDLNLSRD